MARTRRAVRRGRAVSRKGYRARGGMSEGRFVLQIEHLNNIINGFRAKMGGKQSNDTIKRIIIDDFKNPIMQSIHGNTNTKKKEVEHVIDNFINLWVSDKDITGVWNHLIQLLFPGEYKDY